MGKLVAVYGDQVQLESALQALEEAGLSASARVVGNGHHAAGVADNAERGDAQDGGIFRDGGAAGDPVGAGIVIPPIAAGGSGAPPVSTAVLAPLAVPPGGSRAVGVVGDGPGTTSLSRDLERITGGNSEESGFYGSVLDEGGSLLVVEGDDSELDRAEVALAEHGGQGMTRR